MTVGSYEEAYLGVININNIRVDFFTGNINNLEADATNLGNAYLHGFIKENIYTMAGPVKYNPIYLLTNILIPQHHYNLMKDFFVKPVLEI